jgi:Ni,Fe-hydrogenase I small subunit
MYQTGFKRIRVNIKLCGGPFDNFVNKCHELQWKRQISDLCVRRDRGCFTCGEMGHHARDCPQRGSCHHAEMLKCIDAALSLSVLV